MTSKSSTTTGSHRSEELLPLIHPGEILIEEFLRPLDMSQYMLARSINVPARRINEIVHGSRAITPDTAIRLGQFFGTSAQFWMNLQVAFDLRRVEREAGAKIRREITPLRPAG